MGIAMGWFILVAGVSAAIALVALVGDTAGLVGAGVALVATLLVLCVYGARREHKRTAHARKS